MAPPTPSIHETTPTWTRSSARPSDVHAARRVRISMYLVFLSLALAVLAQGALALRMESVRLADAELLDLAGDQRKMVQQLGRSAALLVVDDEPGSPAAQGQAHALAQLLREFSSKALAFEEVLQQQARAQALIGTPTGPVASALQQWQAARERLWYRGDLLVLKFNQADPAELRKAVVELQAEVAPAAAASQQLVTHLRMAAQQRVARLRTELLWGMAALLVLLGVLSLAVVEPSAGSVGRQVRRQMEQAAVVQRLALVAEHTTASVLITDAQDRVQWANQAFSRMLGWPLAEVLNRRPGEFMHADAADPAVIAQVREATSQGRGLRLEWLNRRRDGSPIWLDVDLRPIHDNEGVLTGFISVSNDVTERRALQTQLSLNARVDALTQLPNRSAVMERLQRAIDHASRNPGYGFAVLFMDFDRFKQVNDTMGHAAGDELLRQVAQRLRVVLRPGDALARLEPRDEVTGDVAARIGGDEFVVVLEGVGSHEVLRLVADRVLAELKEPYLIGCTPVHSSASIGVVLHLGGDRPGLSLPTAEEVLRNADTAMYEAKRGGRGRWVMFDDSMHERVVRALAIENDLRHALREDELFVVYQPVVGLEDRALVGVEALVRWRHPKRGLVPPAEFIGVAEESGLIDEVGATVLSKACAQFVAWRTEFQDRAPPMLSVNLSRAQLKRAGMVPELKAMLQQCGMRPEWLQLEVTESLAAQDEPVQATLREIKALGVRLALDDFGTGYSSLACLHQLPVDSVKIDRSFVKHAETVEYHRVLIEATIRVARTLGMTTVAEGIETEGQAGLMRELQCDRGQGYLFSRPMDAAAAQAWLLAETAPQVHADDYPLHA